MPEVNDDAGLHQKVNRPVVAELQPLSALEVLPVPLAPGLGRGSRQVVGDVSFQSLRLDRRGSSRRRRRRRRLLLKVVQGRQPGTFRLGRMVVPNVFGHGRGR